MNETEWALQEIEAWLFNHDKEDSVLKVGFWDLVEYTFYAIIEERNGDLVAGESTYGSDTMQKALLDLVKELSTK